VVGTSAKNWCPNSGRACPTDAVTNFSNSVFPYAGIGGGATRPNSLRSPAFSSLAPVRFGRDGVPCCVPGSPWPRWQSEPTHCEFAGTGVVSRVCAKQDTGNTSAITATIRFTIDISIEGISIKFFWPQGRISLSGPKATPSPASKCCTHPRIVRATQQTDNSLNLQPFAICDHTCL
jgi:hypothetical protein